MKTKINDNTKFSLVNKLLFSCAFALIFLSVSVMAGSVKIFDNNAPFNIVPAVSQNELMPGAIKIDSAFEQIANLYSVSADANLNSTCIKIIFI